VGGGAHATVNELIDYVQRVLGIGVEVSYGAAAEGDVRSTWADLELAERELGYQPQVGLEEGIKAQVQWTLRADSAPSALGEGPDLLEETTS
jgi:nucleoside-diphosphate-sugar epimerase